MKKKVLIVSAMVCVAIGIIAMIVVNKNMQPKVLKEDIKVTEYDEVVENCYLEKGYFDDVEEDKNTIIKSFKILSKELKRKYKDTKWYIYYHLANDEECKEIEVNFYQMVDSVIIVDTFSTVVVKEEKISGNLNKIKDKLVKDKIDTKDKIEISKAKDIASKYVEEKYSIILEESKGNLNGTCEMHYKKKDGICYMFYLNDCSFIKINAISGEIIDSQCTMGGVS